MTDEKMQWYHAFAAALKLEMKEYYPDMLAMEEYEKPSDVGVLFATKDKETEIQNGIGSFFKRINIIEYKPPGDYLDMNDYYKAKGLAYLYKSLGERNGGIELGDITITMISNYFPIDLLEHMHNMQGNRVTGRRKGIYHVIGDDISTQVIVINELAKTGNRYIRLLNDRIDIKVKDEIRKLLSEYVRDPGNPEYEVLMGMVADIHPDTLMEVLDMVKGLSKEEKEGFVSHIVHNSTISKKRDIGK